MWGPLAVCKVTISVQVSTSATSATAAIVASLLLTTFKLLLWPIGMEEAHDVCHWASLTCQQVVLQLIQTLASCLTVTQLLDFFSNAPPKDVYVGLLN